MSRAKKQLQSMLMMNLESRIVMFEDIGRLATFFNQTFTHPRISVNGT